ncbi:MAG: glycine--tRNA ligase subunit alpha [Anaerolineales bacterium]
MISLRDNWEQPAISAWAWAGKFVDGRNYAVHLLPTNGWCCANLSVDAYGLERIHDCAQQRRGIWNEDYGAGVTYGEITAAKNTNIPNIITRSPMLRAHARCTTCTLQADNCLEQGLLVPRTLITSSSPRTPSTFSMLNGAISVAERRSLLPCIRELARKVAEGCEVAQRT